MLQSSLLWAQWRRRFAAWLLNLAVFAELEGRQLGADLQARGEQFPFYGDPDGHRRVRAALDKVISKLS
jgi:hypothetical protein